MATVHPWAKPFHDVVAQQYRLDAAAQQDFDAFFARVNAMASSSADQGTFVTQFTQSPLFTEYNQLLEKYQQQALTSTGQTVAEAAQSMREESARLSAEDHAKTKAEQKLNEVVTQMLPDEINSLRWGGLRAIPVIGPIIQWIGNIRWLRSLFIEK